VVACGLTDAPIPWPLGQHGRTRPLVVYQDLAEPVRRESALAVCHWWGVSGTATQRSQAARVSATG
jgi:hypothetical protein